MTYYSRTLSRDMERIRNRIEIEKAKMRSTIQWKMASQELPTDNATVLVATKDPGDVNAKVRFGHYYDGFWTDDSIRVSWAPEFRVIAWAPMPTPPRI